MSHWKQLAVIFLGKFSIHIQQIILNGNLLVHSFIKNRGKVAICLRSETCALNIFPCSQRVDIFTKKKQQIFSQLILPSMFTFKDNLKFPCAPNENESFCLSSLVCSLPGSKTASHKISHFSFACFLHHKHFSLKMMFFQVCDVWLLLQMKTETQNIF